MNTEFHYWLTGLIAKESGFSEEDAKTIAYSSEYVDENDVNFVIKNRSDKKDTYSNYISQTMNILKPKNKLMKIYPVFHFIPGEPDAETALRKDGKMHLLNTTPNSGNANEIMDQAFKAAQDIRAYRIGIASHTFVDTWAHQNFVGWYDYFNNIGLDIKPDIGHADAEHHPDYISHIWMDERLTKPEIDNRARYMSAAQTLFLKYCEYNKSENGPDNSSMWNALEQKLSELMGETYTGDKSKYKDERIEKYKETVPWLSEFDEKSWFDEAIDTKVRGLKDSHRGLLARFTFFKDEYFWKESSDKTDTNWYKFQEAVKEHQSFALKVLSKTFNKMGINIYTS